MANNRFCLIKPYERLIVREHDVSNIVSSVLIISAIIIVTHIIRADKLYFQDKIA